VILDCVDRLHAVRAPCSDEWTNVAGCLLRMRQGSFPPEPIRYLAGRVVRASVARKERAEQEGRAPTWIDKKLARLAPATVTDVFRRRPA
jgi:hypothetical protein